MFVLSNAWRALTRSKGRTALTAFITLAVTFGTVAGLAIIKKIPTHTPPRTISKKGHVGHSPDCGYVEEGLCYGLGFHQALHDVDLNTEYATLVQSATNSLNFTVTETVPARVSGDLKALDGGSLGSASDDETGGQLIWRAFWTKDSARGQTTSAPSKSWTART